MSSSDQLCFGLELVSRRSNSPTLAFYDVTARNWKAEAGGYQIEVGTSSRDLRLQRLVSVRAERRFDQF